MALELILETGVTHQRVCTLRDQLHRHLTPSFVSNRFKHSFCSLQQKTLVSTLHY